VKASERPYGERVQERMITLRMEHPNHDFPSPRADHEEGACIECDALRKLAEPDEEEDLEPPDVVKEIIERSSGDAMSELLIMLNEIGAPISDEEGRMLNACGQLDDWLAGRRLPGWTGKARQPAHVALRGSDVEAYLKRMRDRCSLEVEAGRIGHHVLDLVLDDYRLHADTGTSLDQDVDAP
jgi:hypothetical protein